MRILLDECVDPRVKLLLGGHNVATVHEQGWDALEDGPLLMVPKNQLDHYRVIQKETLAAVEQVRSGEVLHVCSPQART